MTPVTAKREKTAENNRRRAAGIPFFSAYRQGKINYTVFFAECQGKSIARKPPEPLAISGFSTLSTGKTDTPRSRKTTFCDDFEISVMQVLQFLTDKIAVLSAFLPVYMLCKTYVSIHKLCNLHKGEKSQKSSNFVRKSSGGKPADKADFLTFGNIFGAFCLTVKKVLRRPRGGVSVLRHLVLRRGFRSPPQLRTVRFPLSAETPHATVSVFRCYLALKDEVKEAEQIRKGVCSILRQKNRKEQPTYKQDLDR